MTENPKADDSAQELKALLDAYAERKQTEGAARDAQSAEEGKRRAACVERLSKVALPTLNAIIGQLTQAGHSASLEERTGSYAYPSLELSFTPKSTNPHATMSASSLRFLCDPMKGVSVKSDIRNAQGTRFGSGAEGPPVLSQDVTAEWVRSQALQFVDEVLRAN